MEKQEFWEISGLAPGIDGLLVRQPFSKQIELSAPDGEKSFSTVESSVSKYLNERLSESQKRASPRAPFL